MAYVTQAQKKELAPAIKAVLKKYNMKGSIAVSHHSTLVVNLREGSLDLIAAGNERNRKFSERHGRDFYDVGTNYEISHHIDESFDGEVLAFLQELHAAMMKGNHDNSDVMTDYFDVGWYTKINVGQWNKPYTFNA